MDPNLIILAAGVSSRMKQSAADAGHDEATTRPKSLIRFGGTDRPFLDYVLSNARTSGYKDVVLVIGANDDLMREYYGTSDTGNAFHGLSISYAVQDVPPGRDRPLGTADAVLCGVRSRPDWAGKRFTVCNSDNIYSVAAMSAMLTDRHLHALAAYDTRGLRFTKEQEYNNAILEKDSDGFLLSMVEKPGETLFERTRSEQGYVEVSMNLFRFSYDSILPFLEATPVHAVRQEKELATTVNLLLVEQPRSMFCIARNEFVPDLTAARDIPAMKEYVERTFPNGPFSP